MRTLLRRAAWLVLAVLLAYIGVRMLAVVGNAPASPAPITNQASIKPTPIGGGTGRIAFATYHDDKFQIYTIKSDGTELIHVTDTLTEPQSLR